MSKILIFALIGVLAAVMVVGVAIGMNSGDDSSKDDPVPPGPDGKVVKANASTLLPSISCMDSGWISTGIQTVPEKTYANSGSGITFADSYSSSAIVVSIYVFDTTDHAKQAYNADKSQDEAKYPLTTEKYFDQCYSWKISGGITSTVKEYTFVDHNVYGTIYATEIYGGISTNDYKAVINDIEKKIDAALV